MFCQYFCKKLGEQTHSIESGIICLTNGKPSCFQHKSTYGTWHQTVSTVYGSKESFKNTILAIPNMNGSTNKKKKRHMKKCTEAQTYAERMKLTEKCYQLPPKPVFS